MTHDTLPLEGFTILVVEDEPLIALDIATILEDAGAGVIGPFGTLASAVAVIEQYDHSAPLSGAVLDVNLGKDTSVPIARLLHARGIPFVFHTGVNSGTAALLRDFDAPVICKPSTGANLTSIVAAALATRSGS